MDFRLSLVRPGDRYGRNNVLVNDSDEAMIEFFDPDSVDPSFGDMGQFVSRYHVSTLRAERDRLEQGGIDLHGGEPKWKLSGEQMREVFAWLDNIGA